MATLSLIGLALEVAVTVIRFVIGFYAFWLVLRALEGVLSEDMEALGELSPLACDFTDPFVQPVSRVTRLPARAACWVWLVAFAAVQVALGHAHRLL